MAVIKSATYDIFTAIYKTLKDDSISVPSLTGDSLQSLLSATVAGDKIQAGFQRKTEALPVVNYYKSGIGQPFGNREKEIYKFIVSGKNTTTMSDLTNISHRVISLMQLKFDMTASSSYSLANRPVKISDSGITFNEDLNIYEHGFEMLIEVLKEI